MTAAIAHSVTTGTLAPGWKLRVLGAAVVDIGGVKQSNAHNSYFGPFLNSAAYTVTAGDGSIDIAAIPASSDVPATWDDSGTALADPLSGADVALGGAPGGAVATDPIFTAKGDLPIGTGAGTAIVLSVPANRSLIIADSTQPTGYGTVLPEAILDQYGNPLWPINKLDPRNHQCKGDGKIVLDAGATLVTGTTYNISSATANGGVGFANADIGKRMTVMNRDSTGTSFATRSGVITSIVSTNLAQVGLDGALAGTLTNMRVFWGTDDTANMQNAATLAAQQGLALFLPVLFGIKNLTTLPDYLAVFGNGADQTRTWARDIRNNSGGLIGNQYPGSNVCMVVAGFGTSFYNVNVDGNSLCDKATIDFSAGAGKGCIANSFIAAGNARTILSGATCNFFQSSFWAYKNSTNDNVNLVGDNMMVGCQIAGSGNNNYEIRIQGSDVDLINCHSWKDSEWINAGRGTGGQIIIAPNTSVNSHTIRVMGHICDSSVGPHITVDLTSSGHDMDGLILSDIKAFQHSSAADGSYPYVKFIAPSGRHIHGLTIEKLKGLGSFDQANDGTSGKYTYLVDASGVVAGANIYGSVTGGCLVSNCADLYAFGGDWKAWDRDYGNVVMTDYANPPGGYKKSVNKGAATQNGVNLQTAYTIAHGMGIAPSNLTVTPGSADAAGAFYATADATNITVTYSVAPSAGTNNLVHNWTAAL